MNNRIKQKRFFAGMKSLFMLLIAALAFNGVQSQGRFYIAGPATMALNQTLQLDLVIENVNAISATPPSMPDFQLVGGPEQSTYTISANGRAIQTIKISYYYKPKHEGTFKSGKANIGVNSNNNSSVNMASNELTITVTKAPPPPPPAPKPQNMSEADIVKQIKDNVFVKLFVSRASVYEGEMLTVSYKLYLASDVESPRLDKVPAFEGFLSQEVPVDPRKRPTNEVLNGREYTVFDVCQYNLYPQRTGTLKLPSVTIKTVVDVQVRTPRNQMDAILNGNWIKQFAFDATSETGSVLVKPLPDKDKPADFSGAVGKFNFTTSISGKEGKTDDPITYTVKVEGTGNLKLIQAATLKLPPAFEVYDPKAKENITNGAAGLTGSKQYDFLIIPRQPGEYKIDSKSFSYFDPTAGKYVTINSPEYALKITGEPSKNLNVGLAAAASKQDISMVGQDIRYIKTNMPVFAKDSGPFLGSAGFIGMYSAPAMLFFLLIGLRRRNETLAADVVGSKRRRALKLAKKRLSLADRHLKVDDKKAFYDEVSRATWGYLGDKLNIDMAELSKDNVAERLQVRSVQPETIAKLIALITTCEMALYAPVSDEHSEMKKNYDTAMNLIADLEDEVKA